MLLRRWSWLIAIPLSLVAAATIVRFAYLRRDFLRELGDDLGSPLQSAHIEVDGWIREQKLLAQIDAHSNGAHRAGADEGDSLQLIAVRCGAGFCAEVRVRDATAPMQRVLLRVSVSDSTFRSLDSPRRRNRGRTSLLARSGDSVLVLASGGRDPTPFSRRTMSWKESPAHVRKAFSSPRPAGTADDGLIQDRVIFATAYFPSQDWVLLREVHATALVERLLAPLAMELALIASLFLLAFGLFRSRARVADLRKSQALADVRADFVAAVSHELRTPLAQVRMFAELLRKGSLKNPDEVTRALRVIEKEASRLSILVDNVLNFARLNRNGRGPAAPMPQIATDISRDIEYVMDVFAPLALEKEVRIVVESTDSPRAMVDEQALRQILFNFLENAVKYGPRGQTVTLGTRIVGRRVRIWVDDQGPGVPASERDSIWSAFHRGSAAQQSGSVGSGLGLSIVRDLAAQHGGIAWVEPGAGGGARFIAEFERATGNDGSFGEALAPDVSGAREGSN